MSPITYLKRSQINDDAYDRCVASSPNRLIYAFSWYLDTVSPDWAALVEDDYKRVMPLPLHRFYGVARVVQPLFCQQLGLFTGSYTSNETLLLPFLQALRQTIQYVSSYQFHGAFLPKDGSLKIDLPVTMRTNWVLDLRASYPEIQNRYSSDRRANLRRGMRTHWRIEETDDVEILIDLFSRYNTGGIGRVAPGAYGILRRLIRVLHQQGQVQIRVAIHHRVEAGCVLVTDRNRLIHLFCAASPKGRRGNARTVILDQFIQEYAGQNHWFDFESPEVLSIAEFNRSFGAIAEPYYRLIYNRLPFGLQKLQRIRRKLLFS